jgi:hypothetical protein
MKKVIIKEGIFCKIWKPEIMFTTNNLEDFGLRQFSDGDDWINMKKARK